MQDTLISENDASAPGIPSKVLKGGSPQIASLAYLKFRTFAELGVANDDLLQPLVRHLLQ